MKRLIALFVGAFLALGVAQVPAKASSFDLGTIATNGNGASGGGALSIFWIPQNISDTVTFKLQSDSSLTGALLNVPIAFGGFSVLNTTNLALSITGGIYASPTALSLTNGSFSLANLAANTAYTFKITGQTNGFLGGVYALAFSTAAATPIPASLVMFLTALVGLGGVMYRRRLIGGSGMAA